MTNEIVEQIFMMGANACYDTLNPNTGICDKELFAKLKQDVVKLFCQPAVSGRSEQLDCCGCDYVRINDNCMECRKCGNVIDVAI